MKMPSMRIVKRGADSGVKMNLYRGRMRVAGVMLGYSLIWAVLFGVPAVLMMVHTIPYRLEMALCMYAGLPVIFILRGFLLGGGLHARLTAQINEVYGDALRASGKRFIDLHCLSMLRIFDVWLVFPSQWFIKLLPEGDAFMAFEETLDQWAAVIAKEKRKKK